VYATQTDRNFSCDKFSSTEWNNQHTCSTGKKKKKTSSKKSSDSEVDGEVTQTSDATNHNNDNGSHDVVNGCNGNGCISPHPAEPKADTPATPAAGGRRGVIEDIKEEEDVVPDLPIYEDPLMYGGLRKLSRSKSGTGKNQAVESCRLCNTRVKTVARKPISDYQFVISSLYMFSSTSSCGNFLRPASWPT
jgi:hypothetical protein